MRNDCVQILILRSSHTNFFFINLGCCCFLLLFFALRQKSIFLAAQHISMNFQQTWKYLKAVTAGMSASLRPPHVSVVPLGNCSHEQQHTNKWKMKGRNGKRPLRKRAKTNNIQWKESEAISTCSLVSLQSSNGYLIKSRDFIWVFNFMFWFCQILCHIIWASNQHFSICRLRDRGCMSKSVYMCFMTLNY